MSKKALWVGATVVAIGVGWYLFSALAPNPYLEVVLQIEYDSQGKFKSVLVTPSNATPSAPTTGFICYDELNQGGCTNQWKLKWVAVGLAKDEELRISAKNPSSGNGKIFNPAKLDYDDPELPAGKPMAPVNKDISGAFLPFCYKIVAFKGGQRIGVEDPDIMPHGPGGLTQAQQSPLTCP